MLAAAPFASLGFITYQSMNAEQIVLTAWHSFLLSKTDLIFKPVVNLYYEMFKTVFEKQQKEVLQNNKKLRKTKKAK